jgi:hypothetical protein
MTVEELIAALEQIEDKSLPVQAEGCDCINPATGTSVRALADGGKAVLIRVNLV